MNRYFSKELGDFIRENSPGMISNDLIVLIHYKFGPVMTLQQLRTYRKNHHIKSGVDTRFVKGQPGWNKGMTWNDFMPEESQKESRKTTFHKGNVPHNHVPVGTIIRDGDGYLKKKIAEPDKWNFMHRLVWEEHNGPIPKGHIVIFKDGNKENPSIDNLMLISKAENSVLNHMGLRTNDADLTETGVLIAKVKIAARKRERE